MCRVQLSADSDKVQGHLKLCLVLHTHQLLSYCWRYSCCMHLCPKLHSHVASKNDKKTYKLKGKYIDNFVCVCSEIHCLVLKNNKKWFIQERNCNVCLFIIHYVIYSTIVSMAEKLYGEYFTSVISPIGTNDRVTFFMPSENALRKIPRAKLNALNGLELANVSAFKPGCCSKKLQNPFTLCFNATQTQVPVKIIKFFQNGGHISFAYNINE